MDRTDWDRRYEGEELLWRADPNRFVAEETADLEPGRALDLACGEGRNAIWLAERGWAATGVDFSGVALSKARHIAESRFVHVDWIEADVRTWTPEPVYDLVVLSYVQLPAEERRAVHRAAAAGVRDHPGARLLVVAHDRGNLTGGVGGPQEPAVLSTAEEVVADLEGSGLQIERAEQVRRPVETVNGTADALDLLVRAVRTSTQGSQGPQVSQG